MTAPESTPDAPTERAKAIARLIEAGQALRQIYAHTIRTEKSHRITDWDVALSDWASHSIEAAAIGGLRGEASVAKGPKSYSPFDDSPGYHDSIARGQASPAIQRGDGQTKADLALAEEYASAIIRHSESYGSVAKGFALACFDEVIRKAQLLPTPPAAEPNETPGATRTGLLSWLIYIVGGWNGSPPNGLGRFPLEYRDDDEKSARHLLEEHERDVTAALKKENAELKAKLYELAAVRKSAGAEGAIYETHYDGSDQHSWVTRVKHGPYVAYHYVRGAADQLTDLLNAAKSTPGVDAVETAVAWIEEMSRVGEYPHLGSKDDCNSYDSLIERKAEVIAKLRAKPDAAQLSDGASGGKEGV